VALTTWSTPASSRSGYSCDCWKILTGAIIVVLIPAILLTRSQDFDLNSSRGQANFVIVLSAIWFPALAIISLLVILPRCMYDGDGSMIFMAAGDAAASQEDEKQEEEEKPAPGE
jgi:hypothetical protein